MKVGTIYFVLYIILITELLVVITERDDAQRKLHNQVAALDNLNIEKHELPLKVSIPQDTATYLLPNNWTKDIFTSVIIIPENLVSDQEVDSVVFHVDIAEDSPVPPFWPAENGMNSKSSNTIRSPQNGELKYFLKKNGKYCQFYIMLKRRDIPIQRPEQYKLFTQNKLKYKFNVFIEGPRIISNDFNAKSQGNILKGLSQETQLKFLRSLPDSSEIKYIKNFISKDTLTRKDTTKFFKLASIKKMILKDSLKLNNEEISNLMSRTIKDSSEINSFVIVPRQF